MTEILTHAGISGFAVTIILYFVKRMIAANDRKHLEVANKFSHLDTTLMEIKISLAKFEGQLTQALAVTSQLEILREKTYNVESQLNAVWRILDKERLNDN